MIQKNVVTVLLVLCTVFLTKTAVAEDCDPAFQNIEAYYCKVGNKDFKIGLKTSTYAICVEHKKLELNGCELSFSGKDDDAVVYFIGTKAQGDKMSDFEWQCDPNQPWTGMRNSGFEGHLHPDYTIDKYPGESNSERDERFGSDLGKKGKFQVLGISVHTDMGKQVCQFFNAKTNTIAVRASVGGGGGGALKMGSGDEKQGPAKGLKKLFGR